MKEKQKRIACLLRVRDRCVRIPSEQKCLNKMRNKLKKATPMYKKAIEKETRIHITHAHLKNSKKIKPHGVLKW